MRQLVHEGRSSPIVAETAEAVVAANPHMHPVESVFRFVQRMPYRYDEDILKSRGISEDTSELLQGAPYQLQKAATLGLESVEGDCDDRSILTQSLLESLGYETRFVLVRGPGRPDYSHVYSEVADGGQWVPLDTIFNGTQGRPAFNPGDEAGARLGARDRLSIPVDGCDGVKWLLLALGLGLLLGRRT